MLDVLLINPVTMRTYKKLSAEVESMPPLGLMYVGTYLRGAGYRVELIDFGVEWTDVHAFRARLLEERPAVIGISTFTECYTPVKVLAATIKATLPDSTIVIGGPAATFSYQRFFREAPVDYAIKGEGEFKCRQLVDWLLSRTRDTPKIEGVIHRDAGPAGAEAGPRERVADLDSLCWPDRDLVHLEHYQYPFTISTSRGCPGNCIFCSSKQFWGRKIALRSPENIVEEIKHVLGRYDMKHFFIVDDTFTLFPKRAMRVAELLRQNDIALTWGCESRADVVSRELLQALYDAGCRKIQFGLESGNDEILKKIGKGITCEQVRHAVELASGLGMDINVSFIIGHAFDTHSTIRQTLELGLSLFREFRVTPYCAINTPYPGTKTYDTPQDLGVRILTDDFDNYTMENAVIETANFGPHDLRMYMQSFQDVCLGKEEKLFYQ